MTIDAEPSGRLRVGVYNRFWPTAGGGEKFAGGLAQAIATRHDVTLIGHDAVDLDELAERLQLDLGGVGWRSVDLSPRAVEEASADVDLFVNVSYGSVLANRARRGLYVVHFPTIGAPPPTGWRRFLLRAAGRLARITGASLDGARWVAGAYAPEPLGPLTHRWTDGHGTVQLTGAAAPTRRVTVVLGRLAAVDGLRRVELRDDGEAVLGSIELRPRRRRWTPPVAVLRGRVERAAEPTGADPVRLHLHSATHIPTGRSSDERRLGASVLAVLHGPWYQQLLQAVHQPLSAAAAELSFLDSYDAVVANSAFTARWIRRLWGIDTEILHPPVSAQPRGEKGPVILHVGRFFAPAAGHSKRQLELVDAFARLVAGGHADGWTLHLVGGCDAEGRPYLDTVRAAIGELPVQLHVNAPAAELRALFAEASIYWHATGLGEDPDAHPERMEHFGIATAEAMSAGAVPVAIGVAGQLEVFDDGVEGYHFDDVATLVARTASLIADPARRAAMSDAAQRRAERYGDEAFRRRVFEVLDGLSAGAPCAPPT